MYVRTVFDWLSESKLAYVDGSDFGASGLCLLVGVTRHTSNSYPIQVMAVH